MDKPWRKLETGIVTSAKLARCTDAEYRLYISLIAVADDYGRLDADIHTIGIKTGLLATEGSKWNRDRIRTCIKRLFELELLVLYEVAGRCYCYLNKFQEIQTPGQGKHRTHSRFPAPPLSADYYSTGATGCEGVQQGVITVLQEKRRITDKTFREEEISLTGFDSKTSKTNTPYSEIQKLWNDVTDKSGLPSCEKIEPDTDRGKDIRRVWKQHPDIEWWKALFTRIAGSQFLRGENKESWCASLGWCVEAKKLEKILQGNYDDRTNKAPSTFQGNTRKLSATVDQTEAEYLRGFDE